MKTADHLFLGKALSDKYMKSCSVLSKKAFILGNIFPDINFFTYLRGVVSRGKVRGHNYESSEKCSRKLTQKIRNKNRFSFLGYFKLGELVHYITDAFTFPHNDCFGKNLKKHMEYEEKLHTAFSKSALIIYNYLPEKLSLFERIARLHAEYLPRAGTYLWDIEHIYRAVQITMNTVFIKYQRGTL